MSLITGVEAKQKEKEERFLKEKLEIEREKVLQTELEKIEREKDFKRGKVAIKQSGIMDAYDSLLDDLAKNGMP